MDIYESCRRLLKMVDELHQRGYERLRIFPYPAPSGMYWRCELLPASAVWGEDGLDKSHSDFRHPLYSSGSETEYFGWKELKDATPGQLAEEFIRKFPELIQASTGEDPAYRAWFAEVLQQAESGNFPIFFQDYWRAEGELRLVGKDRKLTIRLPPLP